MTENSNTRGLQLEGAKQTLDMLSPQNQELVLTLLRQLAERENINMPHETPPWPTDPRTRLWALGGLTYRARL